MGDTKIRSLNKKFLKKDRPTDVLAFDLSGPNDMIADIIVSSGTAIRNAKVFGTDPRYELYLYVVHGALHLLGYDDKTVKGRKAMEFKASKILSTL